MQTKEIQDKLAWENFLGGCQEKTFLQSWNWGEFQKMEGNKIWRFGIYDNRNNLVGAALVVKIKAKRGTFLFIPHGPVAKLQKEVSPYQILNILLEELKKIAVKENASFIRISPVWERNESNDKVFKGLNFRQAPIHMHAEETWELNIQPVEEEILKGMRKTTRYLIRQAEKNKDISVVKSRKIEDLEKFMPVYIETAKRHNFVIFPERYLKNELEALLPDNEVVIFLGKYQGEVVSAALFVFWQNMAFYHHSGSIPKFNKIPVSYLLQWEAIKEAKKRGCTIYNFWGIAPDIKTEEDVKSSKHPWAGLSLFKMGFGGNRRELVKAQDFVVKNTYWINYAIEFIRKLKRNL